MKQSLFFIAILIGLWYSRKYGQEAVVKINKYFANKKDKPTTPIFMLNKVHHIAIICSDYQVSKKFYVEILGLEIIQEVYREERQSFKLDLALNGNYIVELFSFPNPPKRVSNPEALGLRHLAFEVDNIESVINHLAQYNIIAEPIRVDEFSGKRFTFISDPDELPIEFYER
jgi:glyoxylase I family protein